jgi:hypothetical protein
MWRRLSGKSQRYVNTETGESISRREHDKRTKGAEFVRARDIRYRERKKAGLVPTRIPRDVREQNRRYWRQRAAEQWAGFRIGGVRTDREALADPDFQAFFDSIWAEVERENFEGGEGSAWDELAWFAGAKGGSDDATERARYLAIIGWYTGHGQAHRERWMERAANGRFTYPGLPKEIATRPRRSGRRIA